MANQRESGCAGGSVGQVLARRFGAFRAGAGPCRSGWFQFQYAQIVNQSCVDVAWQVPGFSSMRGLEQWAERYIRLQLRDLLVPFGRLCPQRVDLPAQCRDPTPSSPFPRWTLAVPCVAVMDIESALRNAGANLSRSKASPRQSSFPSAPPWFSRSSRFLEGLAPAPVQSAGHSLSVATARSLRIGHSHPLPRQPCRGRRLLQTGVEQEDRPAVAVCSKSALQLRPHGPISADATELNALLAPNFLGGRVLRWRVWHVGRLSAIPSKKVGNVLPGHDQVGGRAKGDGGMSVCTVAGLYPGS